MKVLSSDTSVNMFVIIIAESSVLRGLHTEICRYLFAKKDCFLHFRKLSSRDKRKLLKHYKENLARFVAQFDNFSVYVLKRSFKSNATTILRVFKKKVSEFKPDRIVLPSDFDNLIQDFTRKFVKTINLKPIINDTSHYTQISDILLNIYRRTRKIAYFPKIETQVI